MPWRSVLPDGHRKRKTYRVYILEGHANLQLCIASRQSSSWSPSTWHRSSCAASWSAWWSWSKALPMATQPGCRAQLSGRVRRLPHQLLQRPRLLLSSQQRQQQHLSSPTAQMPTTPQAQWHSPHQLSRTRSMARQQCSPVPITRSCTTGQQTRSSVQYSTQRRARCLGCALNPSSHPTQRVSLVATAVQPLHLGQHARSAAGTPASCLEPQADGAPPGMAAAATAAGAAMRRPLRCPTSSCWHLQRSAMSPAMPQGGQQLRHCERQHRPHPWHHQPRSHCRRCRR